MSDCNTSTLRFRKAGEFSISDSSSEGSNGSGGSSLAVSGPSSSDVASECRGDTNGCDFCQDEVDATTGEVAWRDGGVINASKVDAIEDRRNSCRIMLFRIYYSKARVCSKKKRKRGRVRSSTCMSFEFDYVSMINVTKRYANISVSFSNYDRETKHKQ